MGVEESAVRGVREGEGGHEDVVARVGDDGSTRERKGAIWRSEPRGVGGGRRGKEAVVRNWELGMRRRRRRRAEKFDLDERLADSE
ncbi:uncharacterized protein A4U43_C03F26670 [Asparagus officinalis]|uniref:Uncharacterized protein n=1 Tax=Asparagus officinalis TaxID=4686 RepID=A0A5P1FID4_ASPOF|nr:uncharacterized protein A4U43_C03F26670 [Asparagus officinalis]